MPYQLPQDALQRSLGHVRSARPPPKLDAVPRSARIAFVSGDASWTCEDLAVLVDRLAAGLSRFGVRPGDRVCLHLRNGAEAAAAYHACWRIGAVAVPLGLDDTAAELEDALRHARPVLYLGECDGYDSVAPTDASVLATDARFVVDDGHGHHGHDCDARPWTALLGDPASGRVIHDVDPDAPAVLLATSGLRTPLKYATHSARTLLHLTGGFDQLGLEAGQVMAFALPMMEATGLAVFVAAMRIGVVPVFVDAADADGFLDLVGAHRCTVIAAAPGTVTEVVETQRERPRDVSSLQWCLTSCDARSASAASRGSVPNAAWTSIDAAAPLACDLQTRAIRLVPNVAMRFDARALFGSHALLGDWTVRAINALAHQPHGLRAAA